MVVAYLCGNSLWLIFAVLWQLGAEFLCGLPGVALCSGALLLLFYFSGLAL